MKSSTLLLISFAFLAFSVLASHHGHNHTQCIHDQVEQSPEFLDVDEVIPLGEDRLLASNPQIRLHPYFGTLTYGTSSFKSYVQYDLVPPVISYFEAALKVKYPLTSPLKVSSSIKTLCDTKTPSVLHTTGVNADHFIFFTAEAAATNYVATAVFCFLSTGIKRPVISKVKLNTNWVKPPGNDVLTHEKNTYTLMHELTHSFGFSSSLFKYWLDGNGKVRTGHLKKVSLQGSTRTVLDVPNLTSRIRAHYGCSSLPGAFLENNGASLTAGSHFERRQFLFDTMTSGQLDGVRTSEFTLAALEGSGWYDVDYSYAEPYHFGAGQGCSFVTGSCSSANSNFQEFCTTNQERKCSHTGRGGGKCQSDNNSDGCKYYNPSINFDCENSNGGDNAGRLADIQVFGRSAGSKCFSGTLSETSTTAKSLSFCFTYSCVGSGANTQLEVQVGNKKVVCKKEGEMNVSGYKGTIDCPDPLSFCQTIGKKYCPRNCMGRGKCVSGKCTCNKGFTGIDCGLRV